MPNFESPARLIVDLDALNHNKTRLQSLFPKSELAPVVKADAYGLGAERVSKYLSEIGCKTFFVARLSEGIQLRPGLAPSNRIYILDGFDERFASTYLQYNLSPVLNSQAQFLSWQSYAATLPAAIHIDTGMNRLGVNLEEFNLIKTSDYTKYINLILSHMACADMPEHPLNTLQFSKFMEIKKLGWAPMSLANSAACLLGEDFGFDMIRPGISLYGGGGQSKPDPFLKPVAHLEARIIQVRTVHSGEAVGYGADFIAKKSTRIGILGIGYADGLLRAVQGNKLVYAANTPCPFIGRISMDLSAIDISQSQAEVGDWVEVFGNHQRLDDFARSCGTLAYEILTRIAPRLPRYYRHDGALC